MKKIKYASISFFLLLFIGFHAVAQMPPSISYTTPQVLNIGVSATLSPTNAGGTVPANVYGTVSTLAGTAGTTGRNNATGTAATFNGPETMVADASGNLYVCDVYNNEIREVTPAGVVTLFAGSTTGAQGFTNGTGTGASFYYPNAIAIDAAGNFYVADYGNNAIRKITSAGVVTTFASGLNQPAGLAFNSAATILYVSEQGGNDIKQITLAGVVSSYAGNGTAGSSNGTSLTTAQFNNVVDLNADNSGNLFIMDYGNNLIRKITGSTNLVSTFAGKTTAGYTNGTSTAAQFNGPYGMVIDGANNIYIGDNGNNNIRLVTSAGVVTTFAGSTSRTSGSANGTLTTATFNAPEDMYINSTTGLMYLADEGNSTIRQIAISGYTISPTTLPAGLTFDATTGIISGTPTAVSAATNYTITAYNYYGNSATTLNIQVTNAPVISYATPQSYPVSTAITTLSPTNVGGATSTTLAYNATPTTPFTGGSLSGPTRSAVDASGNIYVANFSNNTISKFTSAGAVITNSYGTGAPALSSPIGIVFSSTGNMFVLNGAAGTVYKYNSTGAYQSTITVASGTTTFGLAIDASDNLYVTSYGSSNVIYKILNGSSTASALITGGTGLNQPIDLGIDVNGNIYVTNYASGTTSAGYVSVYNSAGALQTASFATGYTSPFSLKVDAGDGYVYASDNINSNSKIYIYATGTAANATKKLTLSVNDCRGMCLDGMGDIYVPSFSSNVMYEYSPTGLYFISPALPGLTFSTTNGNISGTTQAASSPATDYTITGWNAAGSGSAVVNITVFKGYQWKGGTAGNTTTWGIASNWNPNTAVPGAADQASIGSGTQAIINNPIIPTGTNILIGSIIMGTSGGIAPSITVNGTGTLTASGDITYESNNTGAAVTAYTASIAGTGTVTANNLNVTLATGTSTGTYNETLTSSITSLILNGNLSLTSTKTTGTQNAIFNFTGSTLTVDGFTTTNANTANMSTISLTPTSTLNLTGAAAFSGLSATKTNSFTITAPTIGYTGTNDQTVYNSTAIANSSLTNGISYTNIAFSGSGIKTVLSGNLNISGNFTNSLTSDGATTYVDFSSPAVNFTGGSAQSITDVGLGTGGGIGTTFYNVNFSGAGTKTLATGGLYSIASSGLITLTGTTTLAAGTALLTLNSDATGTAGVATLPTGASITGTVYAQRFVTGGAESLYRGYRNMSSPVSSTGTTGGLTDMSYIPASTIVTGAVAGAACTACTVGGNPSLYLYNETVPVNNSSAVSGNFQGVVDISGTALKISSGNPAVTTSGQSLPAGNGFYLFFRGNNISLINKTTAPFANPENVTFTALGTLNQGAITVKDWYNQGASTVSFTAATGATAQGFHLVGNPYPNSIDWHTAFSGTATSGIYAHLIDQTLYVYNVTSKTYSTYLNTSASAGTAAGPPGGSNIIPSGQGFFVHANATGAQLIFNENSKVNSEPSTLLLNSISPTIAEAARKDKHLRIQLYKDPVNIDESVLIFNQNANANYVIGEDAAYLNGSGVVSLSNTSADNKALAISQLPFTKQTQTIPLNVNVTTSGAYQLNMTEVTNIPNLYDIWLKDAYLKDSTNIKQTPNYSFTANMADTTTFGSKRFSLVIRQNALYAYQLLTFTGSKTTGGALLNWTTQNEDIYTVFVVQRSTDGGKTFTNLSTINSTGAGAYSYLDTNPATADDQYRLQQTDVDGVISYSNVVDLNYGGAVIATLGNINVYPNPAANVLNIAIISNNSANATYTLNVSTSSGDVVKTYTSAQANWQGSVSDLKPGLYIIKAINNADKSIAGVGKFVKL